MNLNKKFIIEKELIEEALEYAIKSKKFTSNRHDFHKGGLSAKERKMFEGKLGEKVFKMFLLENNISFEEDKSSHKEADDFDFLINGLKVDIKTRTEDFHTRTLEMVEQFKNKPKDIYVSIRIFKGENRGFILGWYYKEDIEKINRIENNGYLDNYVLYDNELRPIEDFIKEVNLK